MNPWRSHFPGVSQSTEMFLDNAATTHKPAAVIRAISDFYEYQNAPVYRGLYGSAEQLTERFEAVRATVARFIGADPREVVFTAGATDGINRVAGAWARHALGPGDEIVITDLEHHANILPWHMVAQERGCRLVTVPIVPGDSLRLDLNVLDTVITRRTKLVACAASSNIRGPLDNEEISALIHAARRVGAAVLIDAAQVPAHASLDVRRWQPDFMVFSGHKCFGPTGSGILYCAQSMHEQLRPYQVGGGMVHSVDYPFIEWLAMPRMLEAGSPATAAVVGLGAAIAFLRSHVRYQDVAVHEGTLMQHFVELISVIPGIRFLGYERARGVVGSILTFSVSGAHAHDIAALLATERIAVRAGHHCCQPLHKKLGVSASVRVSCALYNTIDELTVAAEALKRAVTLLQRS